MLYLDTETHRHAQGLKAPRVVCVTWAINGRSGILHGRDPGTLGFMRSALEETTIAGWHVSYDMACACATWPELIPLVFAAYDADRIQCLMARAQLADIATGEFDGIRRGIGYSLAAQVKRRLGETLAKDEWRLGYGELEAFALSDWSEGAIRYAMLDAEILERLAPKIPESPDVWRQSRNHFWRQLASVWGIATDPEAVRRYEAETLAEFASVRAEMRAAGLLRPDTAKKQGSRNKAAVKQRILAAVQHNGVTLRPEDYTAAGDISTKEDTCAFVGDPVLDRYAEMGHLYKVVSTDIPLLREGDSGPIHCRFDLRVTGRASSEKPNLMNTPRDGRVKSCFRARKGHVFVHIDAGGLELSTIAQVWADLGLGDTLAKDIRAGVDRHSTVAAALLGTTYEDVRARIEAKDPLAKNGRQTGKVANFGIPGGLGSDRFRVFARAQYGVELTPDESAHVISLWKKLNPEAKNYFALIDRAVSSLGYVEQVRSGRVRGGVSYTEACNTMFQGLGADVMMDWGWRVTRECYTGNGALFGSRVVIFEHDCLIVESPDALAPYAAERIRELMEQAAQYWLPDVPLTGEPALARYWEKDPQPVRGPDGLLLVPPC